MSTKDPIESLSEHYANISNAQCSDDLLPAIYATKSNVHGVTANLLGFYDFSAATVG